MKRYLKFLNNLDPAFSLGNTDHAKVAFILSGQSSFRHSNLSEEQTEFMNVIKEFGYTILKSNFPYNAHFSAPDIKPSLLTFSARHLYQYFLSLSTPQYAKLVSRHLQPLFDNNQDILIIANSMGMQILSLAMKHLDIKPKTRIKVFALGPVCPTKFSDERVHLTVVKGKRDWVSHTFDKQLVHYSVNSNHMGYYRDRESQQILKKYLTSIS